MADFDFLDGFDMGGDWGFTGVSTKPSDQTVADTKATQQVVQQTADGVGKAVSTEIIINSVNLVGGTGENIDAKTDDGWKETLAKISEAHPSSELNKQYGKTSITDIKVNQVREKHKTLAKRRMAKQNPIK